MNRSHARHFSLAARIVFSIFLLAATFYWALPDARAVNIAGGTTTGPDSSFSINLSLSNDGSSMADVLSISINGSTATNYPLLWDEPGTATDPPGATSSVAGLDTQLLTFTFADSPDGFNPGETFILTGVDPDGDPGPVGATIADLAGVIVTFTFEDSTTWIGSFVDNPAPDAGMILREIPEPTSWLLALGSLVALQGMPRRRRA